MQHLTVPFKLEIDFIAIGHESKNPSFDYSTALIATEKLYLDWAKSITPVLHQSRILSTIRFEFNKIEGLCKGIQLLSECPESTKERLKDYPKQLANYILIESQNCCSKKYKHENNKH